MFSLRKVYVLLFKHFEVEGKYNNINEVSTARGSGRVSLSNEYNSHKYFSHE